MLVGPAYPLRGGIAHFLESTHNSLAQRGHDVKVVSFSRQYPSFLFPGKTQLESQQRKIDWSVHQLIDSIQPFSWFKTSRFIENLKPDGVVFNYWLPFFGPSYGVISRRLSKKGITCIGLIHNALPHEGRLGDRALSKYFLSSCDGHIVMSESVERDIAGMEIHLPTIRVAHPVYEIFGEPMPKQLARKKLGLKESTPVALFFGFIRKYKGLHVLLESLPSILQAVPNLKLVVAGESYEDIQIYHRLIESLGLSAHVDLHTDYIPGEDVKVYFSAADVVVQPYISATQSGVAKIAYHFERPVIVTNVGGLAEFVPHEQAGLVVAPGDVKALADSVVRFFVEEMSDSLTNGVKNEKKKYSWARLCAAIEELTQLSQHSSY